MNASKCMHVVHSVGFRKLLVLGRLTILENVVLKHTSYLTRAVIMT